MNHHQGIFHVPFQFGNQVDIIHKQHFEQVLGNISPVGKKFAEYFFRRIACFSRVHGHRHWLGIVGTE
jgi:hypothetical protein